MPRNPVITDLVPEQTIQRRLGEVEETERNRPRSGTGPAGASGAEGAEGKEGHGAGVLYKYLTNTENTFPGNGNMKFGGVLGESTTMRIAEHDLDGNDIGTWLKTWDDNGEKPHGYMLMRKRGAPGTFIIFKFGRVTTSITESGTGTEKWLAISEFEKVGGSATGFANNDEVFIEFFAAGQKGATGSTGSTGSPGEPGGFKYLWLGEQGKSTNGGFAMNKTKPSEATKMFVGGKTIPSQNVKAWLETFDDTGSTTDRGIVVVRDLVNTELFAIYRITGLVTSEAEGASFTIEPIAVSSALSSPLELHEHSLEFYRTGKEGAKGEAGAAGEKGATGEKGETGAEGAPGTATMSDFKESCRAATTANITISTALNNGDVLDGVTLATGNRVLVKNQTTTKENGIWVVGVTPVRSTDADGAGELSGGTTVYVEEGTKNKRRHFKIITAGSITPGTTSHEWEVLTPRDFGIVEALPTTEALKGDRCTYQTTQAGVAWDLVYTEGESYWICTGGSAMAASSNTEREQTAVLGATYSSLPTDPLSFTLPLAGDYNIKIEASVNCIAASDSAITSYAVGATAANDNWCAIGVAVGATFAGSVECETLQPGVAASAKIEEKVRSGGAYKTTYARRRLRAMPIRVK